MKKTTKGPLMALCALLLVVATVFSTMAYLVSQASVKNTFTIGKVKIDMDETNQEHDPDDPTSPPRDKENEYDLTPGSKHIKDPIIHVDEKSQESYLFVRVVNNLAGLVEEGEEVLPTIVATSDIQTQMTKNGWYLVPNETDVYYYEKTVAGTDEDTDIEVFESITIPDTITDADLEKYEKYYEDKNSPTIEVYAYAIQVSEKFEGGTFEEKAAAAWAALTAQLNG